MRPTKKDIADGPEREFAALSEAFRKDPDGYEANRHLGLFLARRPRHQLDAEPYLAKALSFGRRDADTIYVLDSLGNIYNLKGEFEKAITVYAVARRMYPRMPDFALRLGDALFRVGRTEDASATFKETIDGLYAAARAASRARGEPTVHLLGPNRVICQAFGEMAARLDLYLKARELGYLEAARPILLAPPEDVVNPCLLDYWSRHIEVVSEAAEIERLRAEYAANWIYLDYLTLPGGLTLRRDIAHRAVQRRWEQTGGAPLLTLTAEHHARGRARLRELGVPEGAWFAGLHVREPGYYGEGGPANRHTYRNARIETYGPAIRAITERGGWVVRIGDPSTTPLPNMPGVVDYAHQMARSDWMDVFCIAAARFFVATTSGPHSVAVAFGVPTVGTNWFAMGPWPYCAGDVFVHKLLRRTADGRIMSMRDCMAPPVFGTWEPLFFETRGIEPVDNAPDDIADAVIEMIEALDGRLAYSADDDRFQDIYRKLADPYGVGLSSRVAGALLRRHPELIAEP